LPVADLIGQLQFAQIDRDKTVETYDKKSYDKKSRLSIFDLWTLELNNLDLKIGFLVQNCTYNQLEIRKIQTLAPKRN
jgi:hypothetical protein